MGVERWVQVLSSRKSWESSLGAGHRGALCREQLAQDASQVRGAAKMAPLSRKHYSTSLSLPCRVLGLTTLGGSLCPGRYLTFSCCVLMISVSFLPAMSSSNTHMVTRGSKCDSWAALPPTILAITEPLVGGGGQKVEESGHEEGAVTEAVAQGGSEGTAQRPPRSFTCHFLVTPPCPHQHQ